MNIYKATGFFRKLKFKKNYKFKALVDLYEEYLREYAKTGNKKLQTNINDLQSKIIGIVENISFSCQCDQHVLVIRDRNLNVVEVREFVYPIEEIIDVKTS